MPKSLAASLKAKGAKITKHKFPVWQGPEVDGITNSLLCRFLVCRERFRLCVVHGLKQADRFEPRMEYGNMWHVCEEAHAASGDWQATLLTYCKKLVQQYRLQQEDVEHWYRLCLLQFPMYVQYWAKSPDIKGRKPLLQEEVFCVPYKLPSGRIVKLRGKFDSVDLVGKYIWLMENKTKSEIDEAELMGQLRFDAQTMLYLTVLRLLLRYSTEGTDIDTEDTLPCDAHWGNLVYPKGTTIAGVRYNVIKRPLSGGAGTIRRHKATAGAKCPKCKGSGQFQEEQCPKCGGSKRIGAKPEETKDEFYKRVGEYIKEDSFDAKGKPLKTSTYFARFGCQVSDRDIDVYEQRYLIPILEQLCDWWDYMQLCVYEPWEFRKGHPRVTAQSRHWQHPYGCYNPLLEGARTDLDECIANGSEVGLQRTTNLFPELELLNADG